MKANLKNKEAQSRLLELLKTHAFSKREVTLASGQKSNFYLDCKQVSFRGEGHWLIGQMFFELLKDAEETMTFDACGGMAMGALPIASALSLTARLSSRELPVIAVRKEAKGHGTGAFLEGAIDIGTPSKVLLVEDVITTGGSTIKAAQRLREHGFEVDTVFALVDRMAGGEKNLSDAGLRLFNLYDLKDFGEELL